MSSSASIWDRIFDVAKPALTTALLAAVGWALKLMHALRKQRLRNAETLQEVLVLTQDMARRVASIEHQMLTSGEAFGTLAFRADADGEYTWLSGPLLKMVGRQSEDMLGNGWLEMVHPADNRRVAGQWTDCVLQKRKFDGTYRIPVQGGSRKKTYLVRNLARPHCDDQDVVTEYAGYLVVLEIEEDDG